MSMEIINRLPYPQAPCLAIKGHWKSLKGGWGKRLGCLFDQPPPCRRNRVAVKVTANVIGPSAQYHRQVSGSTVPSPHMLMGGNSVLLLLSLGDPMIACYFSTPYPHV